MIAGLNAWGELMRAAVGMLSTGVKTSEMMVASRSVVGARMTIMSEAARRPGQGDYVELGGMVAEKVSAFSKAGQALIGEWSAMLLDASEHAHQFTSLMLRGRPLDARALCSLTDGCVAHGTRMITRTMEAGGLALAPVHQQATANALRLSWVRHWTAFLT